MSFFIYAISQFSNLLRSDFYTNCLITIAVFNSRRQVKFCYFMGSAPSFIVFTLTCNELFLSLFVLCSFGYSTSWSLSSLRGPIGLSPVGHTQ